MGLVQAFAATLVDDLGEVELRREPTANAVVGAEVPLRLEGEGGGAVPLLIKYLRLINYFCLLCCK